MSVFNSSCYLRGPQGFQGQAGTPGIFFLAPIGSSPNSSGATLNASTLNFEPSDATNGGVVSTSAQTLGAGDKTFTNDVIVGENIILLATVDANTGNILIGNTKIHNYSPYVGVKNLFIGDQNVGNYTCTGSYNLGISPIDGCFQNLTSGNSNVCLTSGNSITSGSGNVLLQSGGNITTGSNNLTAGIDNVTQAGNVYTTESNNICLSHQGVVGDSGVMRFGGVNQTKCYVAGVFGTAGVAGNIVSVEADGKLGKLVTGGDVTLSAVGAVPNANGATLTGQVLNLELANATHPGLIGTSTQTFAGAKTFNAGITVSGGDLTIPSNNISLPNSSSLTSGTIYIGLVRYLHNYSSSGTKTNVFIGPNAGNYSNSGTGNTCLGNSAGSGLTSGIANCFLGDLSGSLITSTSNNVIIANTGTAGDANKIKIGNTSHTGGTSIFGISGATSTGGVGVFVNASGVLGTLTSSLKYKNTINDVNDSSKIYDLEVKSFYYNDDVDKKYLQYGLIAEDVEKVSPGLVAKAWKASKKEDGGDKFEELDEAQTVYYHFLPILMLKELQVQKKRIDALEVRLAKAGF